MCLHVPTQVKVGVLGLAVCGSVWVLRTKRHYQVRGTPRVPDCEAFLSHMAKAATNASVCEELRKLSAGEQKELPQSPPPKQAL